MKPPPILLGILFSLRLGCVKAAPCTSFPKSNIILDQAVALRDYKENEVTAKYINHITNSNEKYTLSCFTKFNAPVAVLRTMDGRHIVTILSIPCQNRKLLAERSFMYLKRPRTSTYLILGVLPENSNDWCVFDINLTKNTVSSNSGDLAVATETLWNWSERGVQVSASPIKDYSFARKRIVADYVNNGNLKFVLHCFDDKTAIIRSPMGQRIATISDFDCASEENFVQTFFVHTQTTENGQTTADLYRLNDPQANSVNLPWYDGKRGNTGPFVWGKGREETTKHIIWFYPFISTGKDGNCYWNKINVFEPNTCPSMPYNSISPTSALVGLSGESTKQLFAVVKYFNVENPKIKLTCFKSNTDSDKRQLSVLTHSTSETHIATLTNIDCSSLANLENMFFVQFTYGETDLRYITIGKRDSTTENWCSYSLYQPRGLNHFYYFVYYTFKPTGSVASWKEVANQCGVFEGKIIAGNYKSANYESSPSKRYLWVSKFVSDMFLLFCYTYNDPKTGSEIVIALIKNFNNEVLVSIVGLDCPNTKNKNFMSLRIVGQNKYISIGVRNSPNEDWCRYDMCVDCKDKTVKYSLDNTRTGEEILWSEPGVQWRQGLEKDYEYKNDEPIKRMFLTQGKTSFVIICINGQRYKQILRSAKGTYLAGIDFNFDCMTTSTLLLPLFFVTENSRGDLNLHTGFNCKHGCDLEVGREVKETWLYNYQKQKSDGYLDDPEKHGFRFNSEISGTPGSCQNIHARNMKFGEPYKDKTGQTMVEYRTGADLKIKMFCYKKENHFHADITYEDQYLLTLDNYNCFDIYNVISQLMVTKDKEGDETSVVVIGMREMRQRTIYCTYNIFKIPDADHYGIELFYNFPVTDLDLAWYEVSTKECPLLKKRNVMILTERRENLGTEKISFVGKNVGKNQKIMLRCYENTDSEKTYTSVISWLSEGIENDIEVAFKGMDCTDVDFLKKIYIFYWTSAGKSFISIGSLVVDKVDPATAYYFESWCRYDMLLNRNSPEVNVNIASGPSVNSMFKWFEPEILLDSRPSFKEKFVLKNEIGTVIHSSQVEQTFLSNHFIVTFVIKCYKDNDKRILVITSITGLHLGTIRGYDCTYMIDDLHLQIEKGGNIIYSSGLFYNAPKPETEMLCWYYGCSTPKDPTEKIKIYYSFRNYQYYSKCAGMNVNRNRVQSKSSDWCELMIFSIGYEGATAALAGFTEKLLLSSGQIKTTGISEAIKRSSLIAKYVRETSPKFELHCYLEEAENIYRYYFVINSPDGKPIIMITGRDCSPEQGLPRDRIFVDIEEEELNEVYNILFVGTTNNWFSISYGTTCETEVMNMLPHYTPRDGHKWEQVPVNECPRMKPDHFYKDESKIPLRDDKLVARYMNKEADGNGILYNLLCYEVAGQGGAVDYVSAIKSLDTPHSVFVKGLHCSTKAKLDKSSYIGTRQVEDKEVLIIGSRPYLKEMIGPWCLYQVCLSCESPQATPTVTTIEQPFEWSENGVKLHNCPSPKREKIWNEVGKSTILAEYEDVFGQECYKIRDDKWVLMLKTKKGMYIKKLTAKGSCNEKSEQHLVNYFHVHVAANNEVFTSKSTSAVDDAVNYCWNTKGKIAESDAWFYYFRKQPWSKPHDEVKDRDENCPCISKTAITTSKVTDDGGATKHEFWNGGHAGIKIKIYVKHNGVDIFISNSINSLIFKIASVDFLKDKIDKLDQVLYVEYEKIFLVIGSRESTDSTWCWYIIYHTTDQIDHIVITKDYKPKIGASQWYKGDDSECEFVKRNQISTKENTEKTKDKEPLLIVVWNVIKDNSKKIIAEKLYNIFYVTNDAENHNDKRCLLVIRTEKGQHLATIQDHQCLLGFKNYMFRYSENPNKLIFGVTNKDERGQIVSNCQYDICFNCNEHAIRLNSHTLTSDEARVSLWTELSFKSEKFPSLKNQGVIIDNVIKKTTRMNEHMPLFVIECYVKSNSEQTAVVRTYTGLILATIPNAECEENDREIELKYILVMKKDETFLLHDLRISKPPEKGKESCWFYGCEVSEIKDKRIFYEAVRVKGIMNPKPAWKVVQPPYPQCPKVDSSETILTELNEEKFHMMADYTNGMNFKLQCYLEGFKLSKEKYISVIRDPEGKYVTSILNVDCISVEKVQASIGVSRLDYGNGLDLFSINLTPPDNCKFCSYIICTNCEQENEWLVYDKSVVKTGSDWTKSPSTTCYSLDRKGIVVNEGEMNLNDYEERDIYINEEDDEENMFILTCYEKSESESYARIRLLNGQLVAYIKNLQCMSQVKLLSTSYMFLMKSGKNKYLVVGTRLGEHKEVLPWCRYDICLDCADTDDKIRINHEDDPENLPVAKWSTDCFEGSTDKDVVSSSGAPTAVLKSSEYPEYNLDCYSSNKGDKFSVIKRGETPLITISSPQCFGEYGLVRTFYIYTLSKDSKYSLIRHGPVKQGESIQETNVEQRVLFTFNHDNVPKTRIWRQKSNPVVNVKDTSGLSTQEEENMCTPKPKSYNELLCHNNLLSAVNSQKSQIDRSSSSRKWLR